MAFKDSSPGVVRLNDYNLRDLPGTASFEVLTISGRGLAPSRDRQMQFPGDVGARDYGGKPDVRRLEVSGVLYADTMPDFRVGLDKLKELARLRLKIDEILYGEAEAQTLWFADESIIHSGTAVFSTTSSITLDTGASAIDDYYNGMDVLIVSGNQIGQSRKITNYTGSTKVADLTPYWDTPTPTITSVFWILDNRYYLVNYSGTMNETRITNQWMKTGYSNITLPFKAVYPFAVSDWKKENIASVNGGDFQAINTGNAPSYPKYEIKGGGASSVDAQVVETTQAFQSNFNKAEGTGILNTVITPSVSTGIKHQSGKLNQALELDTNINHSKHDIVYTDMVKVREGQGDILNLNQGTVAFWVKKPTSWGQTNSTSDYEYIFHSYIDGSNRVSVYTLISTPRIYVVVNGVSIYVSSSSLNAGEWYYLVFRWDCRRTGAGDMAGVYTRFEVYNSSGTLVESNGSASQPAIPDNVGTQVNLGYFWYAADPFNPSNYFNGSFDDLALWDRPLTDSERTTLLNGGTGARADSVGSSDLVYYSDFDGTVGTDMVNPIASSNVDTAAASVTTTTAVTVNGNGDKIFADNDRIVLYDETGYKVQGAVNGTATTTNVPIDNLAGGAVTDADKVGVSLDFSTSTDVIVIGQSYIPTGGAARSVACWMKCEDLTNTEQILFQYGNGASDQLFRFAVDGPDGQLLVDAYGSIITSNSGLITDTKWHHVAVTYDGAGGLTFYVDGIAQGTGSHTLSTSFGSYWESFGAGGYSTSVQKPLDGKLSDMRMYDDELSASEVLTLATRGSHTSGLVGHWKLDENTGTTANDSSASGNDGTLGGGSYGVPTWNQLAYISKNLIADGGMENGGIGGAVHNPSGTIAIEPSKSTTAKFDAQSLKVNCPTGYNSNRFESSNATVGAGEDYVIRLWAKRGGTQGLSFWAQSYSGTVTVIGERNMGVGYNYISNTEFTQVESCYEIEAGADGLQVESYASVNTADDHMFIDNLQALPNLINNGGMEGGADPPTGWSVYGLTATSDADEHSGQKGCKLVATTYQYLYQNLAGLTANTAYEVAFWAKGASGGEVFRVEHSGLSNSRGLANIDNTLTTSYARYSTVFFTGSDTSGYILLSCPTAMTVYLDDVSVVHRPDLSPTLTAMSTNYRYEPTRLGMGYHTGGNENMVYAAVGNKDQSAGRIVFRPQFPYNTGQYSNILTMGNATDYIQFWYYAAVKKFYLSKVVSSVAYEAISVEQNFSANDEIEIGWYTDPSSGVQIFVNGSASGSTLSTNTSALATNPSTLYIGASSNFSNGANVIIDDLEILTKSMPAEWFAEQYAKRLASKNENLPLKYTGTLDTGDVLTIDCASTKVITRAELYDASAGTSGSVVSNTTLYSSNMPILSQNKSMLYFPNTISNGVDIHYRNNYQ